MGHIFVPGALKIVNEGWIGWNTPVNVVQEGEFA